ncbi:MAG: hypothetical protein ACQEP7_02340 [bacterium]
MLKIRQPRYFLSIVGGILVGWLLSFLFIFNPYSGLWFYLAGSVIFLGATYLFIVAAEIHGPVLIRELLEFEAGEDFLQFKTWDENFRVELKQTKGIEIIKDRKFKFMGLFGDCQLGRVKVETWKGEINKFNLLLVFRGKKLDQEKETFEELIDYLENHLYYRERTRVTKKR